MPSKKRKTRDRPTIHPKNKYSDPPDFALLASLYPSFETFVFYSRNGRPLIDWTDYNSTRELTRVLLLHDHGLDWWIPDGQLCPTVPNRSNYIHWIEDLLSLDIIPNVNESGGRVKGFDIGTGANCIYPLLGASLCGWSFVGSDVTDIALEWAERNVKHNSNIKDLIEIRKVESECLNVSENAGGQVWPLASSSSNLLIEVNQQYSGPPILLGVVRDGEKFDFCMCNPPFFESMNEAGSNPKTSCGGTQEEMVCPGGEKAFITRIIDDSVVLKQTIRWYTSMIGRKSNLKFLILKLREVGVTIVKTTEFVQGQTCRWGLAWSFVPPVKRIISTASAEKSALSFMLEGLQSQVSALSVLQSIESFFSTHDASCKLSTSSFTVDVNLSDEQSKSILKNGVPHYDEAASNKQGGESMDNSNSLDLPQTNPWLRFSVFQQIPGTLLVKGSLQHKETSVSGHFFSIFQQLEEVLKVKFCRAKCVFPLYDSFNMLKRVVGQRGNCVRTATKTGGFSQTLSMLSRCIQSSFKYTAAHNRLLAFDCGDFLSFQTKNFSFR